jgi:ribosomal protein S18 acetylase RimI-like enzyme
VVDVSTVELQRVLDPTLAETCVELFREFIAAAMDDLAHHHGIVVGAEQRESFHRDFQQERPKILSERGRLYLALVDGHPAGVSALKPADGEEAELKRMYVRPAYRGLGLARRLLEQIVEDARSLGYRTVLLETLDFMVEAQALYRSLGFAETGRFDGHEGHGSGVEPYEVFMRLDLTLE